MKLTSRLYTFTLFFVILCGCLFQTSIAQAKDNQLQGVRAWPSPDSTRVVLDFTDKPNYEIRYLKSPDRLLIDLRSTVSKVDLSKVENKGPLIKRLRQSKTSKKNTYRLVIDLNKASKATVFSLSPEKPYGHRLVLDLPHKTITSVKATPSIKKTAPSTKVGRDIIIAVDAGHGGEDPGAIGKHTYEKKVTLEIAKRLKDRINKQKGMHAFLIRTGDYYINLNKRSAIARQKKADFLVSIHADGFKSNKPRGASVWVLSNRRATSELGRWMEKHEAHSELLGGAGDLIQDSSSVPFLTEMFLDMSMGNSMDVGYHIGGFVVQELKKVTRLHKTKPVHASLAVLKSPDIPSILVEAGFITNLAEEKLLNQRAHQIKIANAIFKGIYRHYVESPPQGTLFAQKIRAIRHIVRSGESLSILASRYSVTTKQLQSYNNLKSRTLRIGQTIKIPPNYQLSVKSETSQSHVLSETVHVVKRGEFLSSIAKRYGLSSSELKRYNNLRSTVLAIGQKLKIPGAKAGVQKATPPRVLVHKVKRGESLSLIAKRYGKTSGQLKTYNKLRSTVLAVGQSIKIPGGSVVVQPTKATVAKKVSVHTVKLGESLSVIARRYGKTMGELKAYNKLRSTSLSIGQKIKIPNGKVKIYTKPIVHRVRSGESLSLIAQGYGKTFNQLKSYNKLRSSSLKIGQLIRIPVSPGEFTKYKVRSGDSLSRIASRYGTTSRALKTMNNLGSSTVVVGQLLTIPVS